MKFRTFLVSILILLLSVSLFATASMKIIPLSSSIYDDMDTLYQITGISSPSNARPWSAREAEMIFKKINKATLPVNYLPLYERIYNVIHEELDISYDESSSGSFNIELNAEGYYHSNSQDYAMESDWLYSYEERKPALRLEVEYAMDDWVYLFADFMYKKSRTSTSDTDRLFSDLFEKVGNKGGLGAVIPPFEETPHRDEDGIMLFNSQHYSNQWNSNWNYKSENLQTNWPERAFLAVGGEKWTAVLGRDKIKWGNGKTGNFIIDSYTEYNDFFKASLFSENYKFEYLVLAFGTNFTSRNSEPDEYFKVLLGHRFEFRLWDKATLAFSENIAYQGTSFDFKFLNPAFFYHNHDYRKIFNALAHLELDVALPLGLKGYFQYVMDQARAPNENDSQNDAMGYIVGVNYTNIFKNSNKLSINAEFALTDPLLYRRDLVDFIHLRRTHTYGGDRYLGYTTTPEYIGYKYGGDAMIFQLDAEYEILDLATLRAQFFYMKHGKMNFFVSHNKDGNNLGRPNYPGFTVSGEPHEIETTISGTIGFDFKLPINIEFMDISLYSDFSYIAKHNKLVYNPNGKNETTLINLSGWSNDAQLIFGVSIKL